LRLAVADLRDNWAGSASLGLTVADLSDDWAGSSSLGLTVTDLRDNRARGTGLGLTVTDLAGTTGSLPNSLEVDGDTLCANAPAVEVVEAARVARVPDSGGAEGKGLVAAEGEARLFPSTGLYGGIELELVVAGDVANAVGLIPQDAVLECECQGTGELAGLKVTLAGAGVGDINGGDLEASLSGGRAASRGSALSHSRGGEGEDSEGLHSQKIDRADS